MLWAVLCTKDETNVLCITWKAGAVNVFKCCGEALLYYLPSNTPFPMPIGDALKKAYMAERCICVPGRNGAFWLIILYYLDLLISVWSNWVYWIGDNKVEVRYTLLTCFSLRYFIPLIKNSFEKINTKLSYVCNPLVALNYVNPTSNHKQCIAYSSTSLNSSLLKQMNFVIIVGTIDHIFSSFIILLWINLLLPLGLHDFISNYFHVHFKFKYELGFISLFLFFTLL